MSSTQTTRPTIHLPTSTGYASAGSQTPASASDNATSITAPPEQAQTPAPAIDPTTLTAAARGRDQTSPQAKVVTASRLVAPAGTKTGRDQSGTAPQSCGVSASRFPGDQAKGDTHYTSVAGDHDQPTALVAAPPKGATPSADNSPPAASLEPTPIEGPPPVGALLDLIDASVEANPAFLSLLSDTLDDLQRVRIATANRYGHLIRDTEDKDGEVRGLGLSDLNPHVRRIASVLAQVEAAEHDAVLALQNLMRKHPLGPWVKAQKGIGEKQAARLLGVIGDPYIRPELVDEDGNVEPSRPRTVSELWAYCGYKPGQRRRKGEKSNWSTVAKSRAYLIAESMLKAGNREVYDKRKASTEGRLHETECVRCGPSGKPAQPGTPWSDKHRHVDALRVVAKDVLKELWREAKRLHEGGA